MIVRFILLAGMASLSMTGAAFAQNQTYTENINNTGIPRNAPALSLGNIYGLNPCATGTSVGVTTPLFGLGGAVSNIDKECETRNNAAVVITGLKDETLAREILCTIKDVRDAAMRVGKPCLQDAALSRALSEARPAPWAAAPAGASASPERPQPVVAMVIPPAIRPDAPAYCRVDGLAVGLYPECSAAPSAPPVAAVVKQPETPSRMAPVRQSVPPKKKAPPELTAEQLTDQAWKNTIAYKTAEPMDKASRLMARGAAMMSVGDIVAARMYYERAAEAGSGRAAEAISQTYDGAFLASIHAVGIRPDAEKASLWLQRAQALGHGAAPRKQWIVSR